MAKMGLFGRRSEEHEPPTAVGTAPVAAAPAAPAAPPAPAAPAAPATERVAVRDERLVDRDGDTAVYEAHTHSATPVPADPRDTDRDGEVSSAEARAAHERTESRLANRERLAEQERAEGQADDTRPAPAAPALVDRDRDGVDDRTEKRKEPKFRARASMMATLALLVGVTSVYAALTGLLAPIAVALGVVGLLLSFAGLSASGRPKVAGGGLASLALVLSIAGAVLGVLAMNHSATWLDSDVDQVARLRDWFDTQLPFMRGW